MDREEYKRFYKYLMKNEVIPEPYDEESFDEYLFDNYESEQCDIHVVSRTYVYRLRKSGNLRTYEIGYIEHPTTAFRKEYPDSWCDSRICEGFWGNEEVAKKVVSLLNDC